MRKFAYWAGLFWSAVALVALTVALVFGALVVYRITCIFKILLDLL